MGQEMMPPFHVMNISANDGVHWESSSMALQSDIIKTTPPPPSNLLYEQFSQLLIEAKDGVKGSPLTKEIMFELS